MPVPTHMKIVVRGVFFNTPEEWSFSLKFSRDSSGNPDATVNDINDATLDSACSALLAQPDFSSSVRTTEWRAYQIGTDGRMQGNPRLREFDPPLQGTASAILKYPTDQAVCVTSEAANRGPARFGRFYLPSPMVPLAADGRVSIAEADALLTKVVAFAKTASDSIDLPNVESSELLNISAVGAGARQTVQRLKIGRVLDRIERRRRSMLEEYVASGTIDW